MTGEAAVSGLDERQRRERDFHENFARSHREKSRQPVPLDIIRDKNRRPWNAYWSSYDVFLGQDIAGKKILVPGAGFGDDAIRLALLGGEVYASDLSPDVLDIARARAALSGVSTVTFDVCPAESLPYPADFFDAVFFMDMLHHVDIPRALAEAHRVVKSGGLVVINELYTHSALQLARDSRIVSKHLYPRMVRFVYGTSNPYITEDERKLDQNDISLLRSYLSDPIGMQYFVLTSGRLINNHVVSAAKFDQFLFRILGRFGYLVAGRFIMVGRLRK